MIRQSRLRHWLPSNREMVSWLYIGLAAINTFIYYWVLLRVLLFSSPGTLFKYITLVYDAEVDPVAHMLMWDILTLLLTMGYWAWLQHGVIGPRSILKTSVVFGPAAGLALFGWKREQLLLTESSCTRKGRNTPARKNKTKLGQTAPGLFFFLFFFSLSLLVRCLSERSQSRKRRVLINIH